MSKKNPHWGTTLTSAEAASSLMTVVTSAASVDGDLSEQCLQWQPENRAAIQCYNEWITEHGLPLEEFRRF